MQVLEIIQHKHQKQQLNEALPALLIGLIAGAVGFFNGVLGSSELMDCLAKLMLNRFFTGG